jgi:hypothetical protein
VNSTDPTIFRDVATVSTVPVAVSLLILSRFTRMWFRLVWNVAAALLVFIVLLVLVATR